MGAGPPFPRTRRVFFFFFFFSPPSAGTDLDSGALETLGGNRRALEAWSLVETWRALGGPRVPRGTRGPPKALRVSRRLQASKALRFPPRVSKAPESKSVPAEGGEKKKKNPSESEGRGAMGAGPPGRLLAPPAAAAAAR